MKPIGLIVLVILLSSHCLVAAEVRGTVRVNYQGLFGDAGSARVSRVSVALLPAEGQAVAARGKRRHRIEIQNNRMQPAFLAVPKGDEVEFISRDKVYHELFSLSPGEPVTVQLGKAGDGRRDRARLAFAQIGTNHLFCGIHNKSYARIDVVDTSYVQMIEPGGPFRFSGLAAGAWRERLAAPATETRWTNVTAMTAPPPLELALISRGDASTHKGVPGSGTDVGRMYQRGGEAGTGQ